MRIAVAHTDAATASRVIRLLTPRAATPWLLLSPLLISLVLGFAVPLLWLFRSSLFDIDLAGRGDTFVGLANFATILTSREFSNSLIVTTEYTAGGLVGAVVLGLGAALLLNEGFRGRALVRSLILIPWAMPVVVIALIWARMLDPQFGVVNYVLRATGISDSPPLWFSSPSSALPAAIAIQVWRSTPFATVLFLAGLQLIPKELYEAAAIDGANRWSRFWNVTLPGVRQVMTVIVLFQAIWLFGQAFTVVYLVTAGGPNRATDLLTLRTYVSAFQYAEFGTAAAYGVIVFAVSSVLAVAILRFRATR